MQLSALYELTLYEFKQTVLLNWPGSHMQGIDDGSIP